ncbi:MAG: alpha/beta fold hydrolase [Cyclobacteriaceae bacterium]|nr:MAG: alpha/beta fold hydrolase [Cyclobacteriaceae bacterium]
MIVKAKLNYKPPFFLFNAPLEPFFPSQFRNVKLPPYQRERITTPDNDFLDLDWLKQDSQKLAIISHGLEGDTSRPYIKGMAKALYDNGYDTLTWNYRGCSGEMNQALRFYHSGATDDLATVVDHASDKGYREINLIGFSLGGNLTLKYLGEDRNRPALHKAVTFSVPLDLHTSCMKISEPSNWIYSQRFLRSLRKKVIGKSKIMQGIDITLLKEVKTLQQFDDVFTGPIHGFKDAIDYYTQCSSLRVVANIVTPTLIVNAKNDPFLSPTCFPNDLLKNHLFVSLETPERGGHVGFTQFNKNGLYWSEERTLEFLSR